MGCSSSAAVSRHFRLCWLVEIWQYWRSQRPGCGPWYATWPDAFTLRVPDSAFAPFSGEGPWCWKWTGAHTCATNNVFPPSIPTDTFASNACFLPSWRVSQGRLVTGSTLGDSAPGRLVSEIVLQHRYDRALVSRELENMLSGCA